MSESGARERKGSEIVTARLKLRPQDRFSFFKWQDDRERLEAFYHDRQRLEARITTRRIAGETDATRVGLSYDIRPGPRTTVSLRMADRRLF